MSKKRVTIYVEEDVWKDIKRNALEADIPASEYLAMLHLKSKAGSCVISDERVGVTPEKSVPSASRKQNSEAPQKSKYTQKYKEQNPQERCDQCGKSLRHCFC
jgi:hypothetical protein